MSSVPKIGQTCLTAEETYDLLAPGPRAKTALRPLSLRSNFSWTLAGNVVYGGCQWGMLMVLAKLGTPEMVGQFSLGLAITTPLIMFTNLQLRAVQATDASRQYKFGDYFALRLLTTALALLAISAVAFTGGYHRETALVILAVGLAKAFESVSDIIFGLWQQSERMDCVACSIMLKGPLSLAAMGIAISLTGSIIWGSIALAGAWAMLLATYDIPMCARVIQGRRDEGTKLRMHAHTLVLMTKLALPLGLSMMLISLNTNIPRYFIERSLGERELGIFASMAHFMIAGGMVINALGQSAAPRLAKHYSDNNTYMFKLLMYKLIIIGATFGVVAFIVAVLAGSKILLFIYTHEYSVHSYVLCILMFSSIFSYVGCFLGFGITATRAFGRFTLPYLILTAITVGSSAILIPSFALVGAAWVYGIVGLGSCIVPLLILKDVRRQA